MKRKMYFESKNSEECYPKEDFLMRSETEAYEAVREKRSEFFYCQAVHEVTTKGQGTCGRVCKKYAPRNGKSGICKLNSPVYYIGEKVTLK